MPLAMAIESVCQSAVSIIKFWDVWLVLHLWLAGGEVGAKSAIRIRHGRPHRRQCSCCSVEVH